MYISFQSCKALFETSKIIMKRDFNSVRSCRCLKCFTNFTGLRQSERDWNMVMIGEHIVPHGFGSMRFVCTECTAKREKKCLEWLKIPMKLLCHDIRHSNGVPPPPITSCHYAKMFAFSFLLYQLSRKFWHTHSPETANMEGDPSVSIAVNLLLCVASYQSLVPFPSVRDVALFFHG
jgi:hypothetical protein